MQFLVIEQESLTSIVAQNTASALKHSSVSKALKGSRETENPSTNSASNTTC